MAVPLIIHIVHSFAIIDSACGRFLIDKLIGWTLAHVQRRINRPILIIRDISLFRFNIDTTKYNMTIIFISNITIMACEREKVILEGEASRISVPSAKFGSTAWSHSIGEPCIPENKLLARKKCSNPRNSNVVMFLRHFVSRGKNEGPCMHT